MDFPLAPPVKIALAEAVELDDTGYGYPAALGLAEAFAEFAARAARLGGRPGAASSPRRNVVSGAHLAAADVAKPGDRVVINTPVYHPFFADHRGARAASSPKCRWSRASSTSTGSTREFRRRRRRADPLQPPQPDRHACRPRAAGALAACRRPANGAWVLSDEIHAPLTLPGARHVPFLSVSEEAREHGIALVSASKAFNLAGLNCAQFVTASPRRAAEVIEGLPFIAKHAGHFGALASIAAYRDGARLARRRDRGDRPQPRPARRAAGRDAARGRLHAAARRLPDLARPARARTSATTPARRCSSAAASPSTRARPSARRAPASRASTSAPPRPWSRRR